MARAIALAAKGCGHTRPNPPVGAVVVKDGKIVGEGWHKKAGADHAEAMALKKAGAGAEGATVYVTLEPCSKPGRVGACTDALAAAKVVRVVYACDDPNPTNNGRAKRVLAKSGIACERFSGGVSAWDVARAAQALIAPFAKHVTTGMPYVSVKIAMSLDGRICDNTGSARWVSGPQARRITGAFREKVDAIMVGAETLRKDNPSLLSHLKRNDDLVRVIVSRSGKLPKGAQVFTDGAPNETLVFDDAKTALEELGRRGIMHVLCEGGFALARSLEAQGLVDEWISVLCPIVIGEKSIAEAGKSKFTRSLLADVPGGECIAYFGKTTPSALS